MAAPSSMKPKPARINGATALAFLSYPAASPIGLGKSSPATLHRSLSDVTGEPGSGTNPEDSARIDRSCARSGSIRCSAARPSFSIMFIPAVPYRGRRRCAG